MEANTEAFLKAARKIAARVPNVRFAAAAFKESQAELVRGAVAEAGVPVDVHVSRTPELIHAADCCLACSGSVSLELLYHAKPSVILYRISRFAYFVQSIFRKVRYITLVNLMTADDPFTGRPAGVYDPAEPRDAHVLVPEYLTCEDRSEQLAGHCVEWLTDAAARSRRVAELAALRDRCGQGGASQRAAEYIVRELTGRTASRSRASAA